MSDPDQRTVADVLIGRAQGLLDELKQARDPRRITPVSKGELPKLCEERVRGDPAVRFGRRPELTETGNVLINHRRSTRDQIARPPHRIRHGQDGRRVHRARLTKTRRARDENRRSPHGSTPNTATPHRHSPAAGSLAFSTPDDERCHCWPAQAGGEGFFDSVTPEPLPGSANGHMLVELEAATCSSCPGWGARRRMRRRRGNPAVGLSPSRSRHPKTEATRRDGAARSGHRQSAPPTAVSRGLSVGPV